MHAIGGAHRPLAGSACSVHFAGMTTSIDEIREHILRLLGEGPHPSDPDPLFGSSSLREVARQVGMSATGLRKTLDGTNAYAPTLRKLRAWYEARGAGRRHNQKIAALDLLLADVPQGKREEAVDLILKIVATLEYQEPPARPPGETMRCDWPGCGAMIARAGMGSHMRHHRLGAAEK